MDTLLHGFLLNCGEKWGGSFTVPLRKNMQFSQRSVKEPPRKVSNFLFIYFLNLKYSLNLFIYLSMVVTNVNLYGFHNCWEYIFLASAYTPQDTSINSSLTFVNRPVCNRLIAYITKWIFGKCLVCLVYQREKSTSCTKWLKLCHCLLVFLR